MKLATRVLVLITVAALALALVARAQDPLPPVFRGGVDVVYVDVSVLDKDRKPVRGLTAADFRVLEDGKPREIVAFTAVELPGPPPARREASWVRDVPADVATNAIAPEGRVVVILIARVPFANFPIAQRIARSTIAAMSPDDLGAIVFSTLPINTKTVHSLTSDKASLLAAVNQPFSVATVLPDCNFCCLYDKSGLIADALATIRGRRKSIVYIGAPDEPMRECRPMAEAATRKLRLANVTMHELDLAGVEAPRLALERSGGGGGITFQPPVLPGYLPLQTGGQTVRLDNSPEREVAAIFQESASYYVLAFRSSDETPAVGQTHDVAVSVTRPDVTVHARSGYQVGQTVKALEAEARKAPLVRSIEAELPRTDLPLSLSATPFAVPGREKATVAIALRVEPATSANGQTVPEPAAWPGESVNVVIAALDPFYSTIVASAGQKAEIPPRQRTSARGDYELLSRLELAPGRYEIRAALDSSSGARASVYTTLEVARFDSETLSLSGVVVQVSPQSLTVPSVPFADLLPFVPTARREFLRTDRVTAFMRIYQPRPGSERVAIAASIVDSNGRAVFRDRREQTGSDYQLELPVERLAAGEYLLAIDATSGRAKASRNVRFRIK